MAPPLDLPCGRCIGCRIRRTQEWAIRCMNEAAMHPHNSFVTLTYDQEHDAQSLDYTHFQAFLRSLRRTTPVRFFAAGEYGEQTNRPHWHALLFGVAFSPMEQIGKQLYRSPALEKHWPHGYSSIGEVNLTTARYVASYCIKKVNGKQAEKHYERVNLTTGEIFTVTPEMARMSLKPGIGAAWYLKYRKEVSYARDGIVTPGGHTLPTPRYYDKLLEKIDIQKYRTNIQAREDKAYERRDDNTPERLLSKEIVAISKQSQKQRKL